VAALAFELLHATPSMATRPRTDRHT